MKIKVFRTHTIIRSNPRPCNNYSAYRHILQEDFHHRCAYCNLRDTSITTPFEIDHFVPKKECKKANRSDLISDYRNLVYACKKCNNAKRAQFVGDLSDDVPTNELFYDPVDTDYNAIFYRSDRGTIEATTDKGKDQINRLKLFRPIHSLAWVCEETSDLIERLRAEFESELDEHRKRLLIDAYNKATSQYYEFNTIFTAAYNDNDFQGLE